MLDVEGQTAGIRGISGARILICSQEAEFEVLEY